MSTSITVCMSRAGIIVIALTLLQLCSSCSSPSNIVSNNNPYFLFAVEQYDVASTGDLSGFVIESSGKLYSLKSPEYLRYHRLDTMILTEAALTERYSQRILVSDLPLDSVNGIYNAALNVHGSLIEGRHLCYDSPTIMFSAIRYNPITNLYTFVLLKKDGDNCVTHSDSTARKIAEWLKYLCYKGPSPTCNCP